ncbi:MAG: hypothetical protein HC875_16140 [Anaerolineales bacterium]|nr:hypothetical protein [Anaerolineales bacterium]
MSKCRRLQVSLNRVGLVIVAALLISMVSLTLLVMNAEAKRSKGGPGCGGDLASLLDQVEDGDVVEVLTGPTAWDSNGAILTKNITIEGGWQLITTTCVSSDTSGSSFEWPAERSIIGDYPLDSIIRINPPLISTTMRYLDIVQVAGGVAQGGAISGVISDGARLLLDNVLITNSSADRGGGLYLEVRGNSQLILSDTDFTFNTAQNTGGGFEIHVFNNSQVTIINSQVSTNTATNGNGGGGRIVIHSGSVTIANSSFFDNQANGSGKGLLVEGVGSGPAYLILQNNVFSSSLQISGTVTVLDKQTFLPIVFKK